MPPLCPEQPPEMRGDYTITRYIMAALCPLSGRSLFAKHAQLFSCSEHTVGLPSCSPVTRSGL